jgi:hypothetical protein
MFLDDAARKCRAGNKLAWEERVDRTPMQLSKIARRLRREVGRLPP